MPLDGTGKALGIAATSGPERVANASEMRLTPHPRWYAVHIGNNPFPCPCGVISEHSVCATPAHTSAKRDCSPAGRATRGRERPDACAGHESSRDGDCCLASVGAAVHALITGAGVATPTSRQAMVSSEASVRSGEIRVDPNPGADTMGSGAV